MVITFISLIKCYKLKHLNLIDLLLNIKKENVTDWLADLSTYSSNYSSYYDIGFCKQRIFENSTRKGVKYRGFEIFKIPGCTGKYRELQITC